MSDYAAKVGNVLERLHRPSAATKSSDWIHVNAQQWLDAPDESFLS